MQKVSKKAVFMAKQQSHQTASTATATRKMKNSTGGMSHMINAIHQNFDFMSQVIRDSETRARESQQILAISSKSKLPVQTL